ncbi:hypothetical protein [Thermococcus sp.]
MRRWIVLGIIGFLVFGSFVSAGDVCQGFDVDRTLSDVNLKIQNLTGVINQKEADLQELYATFNGSLEALERIVKLEDEVQELRSEREAYERQKLSLELIKRYTVKTPHGLQVLYYNLPKGLVKEYVEKIHPVRKNVDLDWLVAYYRQAGELTFDEYIEVDSRLREAVKAGKVDEALNLLQKRKQIREEIYAFAREKSKLETLQKLKTLGEQQTIMKKLGIEPLSSSLKSDFGWYDGWGERYGNCNSGYIPVCGRYSLKSWLPESGEDWGENPVYFRNLHSAAVWVGIYTTSEPSYSSFEAQYCTHEFFSTSEDGGIRTYWNRAVNLMESEGYTGFGNYGSIQIKYFYTGEAYNSRPSDRSYQKANLIFQFECNRYACWISSYHPQLPNPSDADNIPATGDYSLYINARWLYGNCCIGPDNPECNWANGHCHGCFAPDESASQNFAWVNLDYRICVWPPERYGQRC